MATGSTANEDARTLHRRGWIARAYALSPIEAAYDVVAAIEHDRDHRLRRLASS